MTLVEKLAMKSRMQKVVLTVLINNVAAVEFYRKLNYTNNEKLDKTYRNRMSSCISWKLLIFKLLIFNRKK